MFIKEQGISEAADLDGLDKVAIHLPAFADAHPVGTARLLVKGETGKIGRVCVLRAVQGTGASLMQVGREELQRLPGVRMACLGLKGSATGSHEKLSFAVAGEAFIDAGTPHRHMARACCGGVCRATDFG